MSQEEDRGNNPPQQQKDLQPITIKPPPEAQWVNRAARFAQKGEKRTRYSLPASLDSASPIGYRTRISLTPEEVQQALALLSLERPTDFAAPQPIIEQELFEECSLGVLSSRQSTNYRGHKQVTLGPEDSEQISHILRSLKHKDAKVLARSSYTHIIFSKPYRTPFTMLLTLIGHKPFLNMLTVPLRAWRKKFSHIDDIPTIGYLQHLHIGILADAMERATVIASQGRRRAQVHMAPFCSDARRTENRALLRALEEICGLTSAERAQGWRVALVTQVGEAIPEERVKLPASLFRKMGANLMAYRSERIQPGVNQEEKAPEQYHARQSMDVPEELTVMAGRALYNAFAHWTGGDRERAKDLVLLERVDVLTPGGKERLRDIRKMLSDITDRVAKNIPLWADLPTGKAFSRNTARGKKAFALAGQRIYIAGLSKQDIAQSDLEWELAVRAIGAASARSALYCELMGSMLIPEPCDLLAGICMMAGPVNQNDIGKAFYGEKDLLIGKYPDRDPTSLLVWTLKAKTIADPIGNEEQLLNPKRKGALVDLRMGPHEAIRIKKFGNWGPIRHREGRLNQERAFWDMGNFVTGPEGREIPGNRGSAWPKAWSQEFVWLESLYPKAEQDD